MQDAGTGRIGQDAEGSGDAIGAVVVEEATEQGRDVLGMNALNFAPLSGQHI